MNNFDFNIIELKNYLKMNNITLDLTDEELINLCEVKLNQLEGLIGININPKVNTIYINNFSSDVIFLDYYPVLSIQKLIINDKNLNLDDYMLIPKEGIIYFNHIFNGKIELEYLVGFTQQEFNSTIKALLYDIILYTFQKADNQFGEISSITEGNVSISYNSNTSLYTQINNKINSLKNRYHCRCVML